MSSEHLASAQNELKGNLGGAWNILDGAQGQYQDLGISRRFGGAAAAYSLRDIGAMNGKVVKVRRDLAGEEADPEENFSANQVSSGALEDWVNGKLESTLPADVATAAAAYSLRKVNSSYGIPVTEVNGTENFPATVPSSGSPADIGNGFTVNRFSDGVADSESVTVSGETITVTAIASGTGTFSAGCRIKGLSDNKQYTVSGEFRVTSQGADGDGVALVDISDATAGTDEDSITTSSTTFTPFFIDAGYNGGSTNNFVDLQANSNGSNSGTLTAEFRNVQIIENNNSAVRIRRSSDDEEVVVGFDSDNKVSASSPVTATPSGSTTATDLNGFLNEVLTVGTAVNGTGSFDNYTVTNETTTGFSADNSSGGTGSAGFPYTFAINDVIVVKYTVSNFSSTSSLSPQIRGTTATSSVTGVTSGGTTFTANGTYTDTLTATADGTHLMYADGNTGSYTISDFQVVSHTHQAFVHTWYDQAGSNNAVQETAANQPKIAENGALLADGVSFDGDLFLQKTTTDTTTAASIFGVHTKGTSSSSGARPIGYQESATSGTNSLAFSMDNSIRFDGDAATTSTQTIPTSGLFLATTIKVSNTEANNFINSVSNIADSSLTLNDTDVRFTLGFASTTPDYAYNGSIKEAMFYTSDQSANRFKIESNINNYYGLYNDANETNGDFDKTFSPTADGTFTPNGKDGFTLAVVSNTVYAGIKLNADVTSGDAIYVSFNCSFDAGSPSPKIALRNTDSDFFGSGTLMSNEGSVVNGFNAFTLTSTNSSASGVVLSEADNNLTYSISDFKVSRIARNGFVETWYDQSGNANNASQTTASQQPMIIINGGQIKILNGTPSIAIDRNSSIRQLEIGTEISAEPYTFFLTGLAPTTRKTQFYAEDSSGNRPNFLVGTDGIAFNPDNSTTSGTVTSGSNGDTDFFATAFSGANGGADYIIRFNGTQIKTAARAAAGDGIKFIGRFDTTEATFGHIESWVLYASDLTADFDEIENQLAQPIGLI